MTRRIGLLAGGLLLLASPLAFGQGMSGGTGGFGSSGFGGTSGGGGSTGGFGSSSGGGFAGGFGSSSGGGFAGGFGSSSGGGFGSSSGGGFAGGTGGGGLGGSNTQYGNSSVFGKYLANPYAAGMAVGRANTQGSQYARPFPVTLSFGQAVYNTATVGRTTTTGSTGLGMGLGTAGSTNTNRFNGASSAGIRRAPGYLAEPTFPVPARSRAGVLRPDLQALVARSERLPSGGNIQVSADGETVVLRGQVSSERERRLAEAMIRLTPGVRAVRNELEPPRGP